MAEPNKWPVAPSPPERLLQRLKDGYCLRDSEILMLNERGAQAARLEKYDPNFAREARKWRAERQEAERKEAVVDGLACKKKASDVVQKRRDQDTKALKEERVAREAARRFRCRLKGPSWGGQASPPPPVRGYH